ncbi:glycine zipper 2TM domain-containing protein [Phenylobacterium sp.]|uniref:glycine zipper 2TM domain-containing protein n=1 Tax=Phenylobacterium sp. TaxID=1871053 RepID=UPI003BA8DEDB
MRKLFAPTALIATAIAMASMPVAADARTRTHKVWVCEKNVRHAANTGTVVGAVGGALLGSAVAGHGAKTEGAVIGAGLGGLTGHQLAKKNAKKNCHYVYRRY